MDESWLKKAGEAPINNKNYSSNSGYYAFTGQAGKFAKLFPPQFDPPL